MSTRTLYVGARRNISTFMHTATFISNRSGSDPDETNHVIILEYHAANIDAAGRSHGGLPRRAGLLAHLPSSSLIRCSCSLSNLTLASCLILRASSFLSRSASSCRVIGARKKLPFVVVVREHEPHFDSKMSPNLNLHSSKTLRHVRKFLSISLTRARRQFTPLFSALLADCDPLR